MTTPRLNLGGGRLRKYGLQVEIFLQYRFGTNKKKCGFMTSKL